MRSATYPFNLFIFVICDIQGTNLMLNNETLMQKLGFTIIALRMYSPKQPGIFNLCLCYLGEECI